MYKIFINNKVLYLSHHLIEETNFNLYLLESVNIQKIISKYRTGNLENVVLYHPNKKELLKIFKSKLVVHKAGGGKVFNEKGEVLFIYRNDKWDLPKGGIDKKELIEDTAIREVEEETGCKNLKIVEKIGKTYHVFRRNGENRLKITHWFEMTTDYDGPLQGQIEEGIEKAVWVAPNEIPNVLKNSYGNIQLLFQQN